MRVAIIGAGGFIGQRVARILRQDPAVSGLVLSDAVPFASEACDTVVSGDFSDPSVRAQAVEGTDAVILLAAILGGGAEANYALARKVNVDAALDLFEHLRDTKPETRMVFASTIAVYAKPLPNPVTDTTAMGPTMVYGAQKLMMEAALSNFAAKGWLDGVSLRPSGVMARDGADAALKTAFLSRLFWCVKRGEDITVPVAEGSRTWLTSVETVAQNFIHAAKLPDLGAQRAFTLPALSLTFWELVEALRRQFPDSPSVVTFEPEQDIIDLFGSYPLLETKTADSLGFLCDADADALVQNALS